MSSIPEKVSQNFCLLIFAFTSDASFSMLCCTGQRSLCTQKTRGKTKKFCVRTCFIDLELKLSLSKILRRSVLQYCNEYLSENSLCFQLSDHRCDDATSAGTRCNVKHQNENQSNFWRTRVSIWAFDCTTGHRSPRCRGWDPEEPSSKTYQSGKRRVFTLVIFARSKRTYFMKSGLQSLVTLQCTFTPSHHCSANC